MTQTGEPCCRPGTAARRALALILSGGLWVTSLTWSASASADEAGAGPLAAMRRAAEEAADTEPEQTRLSRRSVPPVPSTRREVLQAAVRTAIRDEVEHAVRSSGPAPGRAAGSAAAGNGNGSGNSNGNGNGNGSGNGNGNGNGANDIGQLRSAVSSAQQARHNLDVQTQRGKSAPHPSPPGQSRAPLLSTGARR